MSDLGVAFVTFDRTGLAFSMTLFTGAMNPFFTKLSNGARNACPVTLRASPQGCLMMFVREHNIHVCS